MHGNVHEWVADWWARDYYKKSPPRDPQGPEGGDYRVLRGGCFHNPGHYCRTAFRHAIIPRDPNHNVGFRVVCEVAMS
jgi:formylglycine-generating enzyme required for sulfatase activity